MDANLKIITHLPLVELWRDDDFSTTKRGKFLTREDVRRFLKSGAVQFVVTVSAYVTMRSRRSWARAAKSVGGSWTCVGE